MEGCGEDVLDVYACILMDARASGCRLEEDGWDVHRRRLGAYSQRQYAWRDGRRGCVDDDVDELGGPWVMFSQLITCLPPLPT